MVHGFSTTYMELTTQSWLVLKQPAALGLEGCCFALVRGPWTGSETAEMVEHIRCWSRQIFAVCSVPLINKGMDVNAYIYIHMYIVHIHIWLSICRSSRLQTVEYLFDHYDFSSPNLWEQRSTTRNTPRTMSHIVNIVTLQLSWFST